MKLEPYELATGKWVWYCGFNPEIWFNSKAEALQAAKDAWEKLTPEQREKIGPVEFE